MQSVCRRIPVFYRSKGAECVGLGRFPDAGMLSGIQSIKNDVSHKCPSGNSRKLQLGTSKSPPFGKIGLESRDRPLFGAACQLFLVVSEAVGRVPRPALRLRRAQSPREPYEAAHVVRLGRS